METRLTGILVILYIVIFSVLLVFSVNVGAVPQGPTVNSNTTGSAPAKTAHSRADEGGTITTIAFDLEQQDYAWKAYVGNVTGKLTLDDSENNTIYDWTMSTVTGEVYATRASSTPTWASVVCANDTVIAAEQTDLSMSGVDRINLTFNMTSHQQFEVSGKNFPQNDCNYTTSTYINDTAQSESVNMYFQEVILYDGSNIIYITIMESDEIGYETGSAENNTYDFQMLVPENESTSQTSPLTYYFYVELG